MRALVFAAALAAASPAAAQTSIGFQQNLDDARRSLEFSMQQEQARQRDVGLANELNMLDSRVRADQAVRDLQALRLRPPLPPSDPNAPLPVLDTGQLAQIPDAALAASNARVRAAAANRR